MIAAQAMLICMACAVYGQTDTSGGSASDVGMPYLGAYAWLGPAAQFTNIIIPDYPSECGLLKSGDAFAFGAGALFELPVSGTFAVQFRAGVAVLNGELRMPVTAPTQLGDGTVTEARVDQVIAFEHLDAEAAALVRLPVLPRLHALGGLILGATLKREETHRQVAVEPAQLLLANNRRVMDLKSGVLYANPALQTSAELGASYDLPVGRNATLTPEVMATFSLTSRTGDGAWRSLGVRGGASLRFGLPPAVPDVPPPPVVDTPVLPTRNPVLLLAVSTEPRIVSVRIDEYDSIEVLPLLNQIFFSETSAELRREYIRMTPAETGEFTNAKLLGSALDVYYQLLNIVGRRMREYPDATLTVNGYRNGRESEPEISLRRAESIRRYLIDVWKIPERRVKVKGGGLPANPARETSVEGYEENARAELIPSDPNILAPILRRHLQSVATPPAITFYPQALAEAGIDSWRLETVEHGKGVWRSFSGQGRPPDSITWDWRSDRAELPALPMQLQYRFSVVDSTGHAMATPSTDIDVTYQSVQQKLENRRNDTTIENYSILLFNYDSPRISPADQQLLRVITDAIKERASIRLVGYTDSLGDAEHNRELGVARAREVERLFSRHLPENVVMRVDEAGSGEHERFPFSTPEGRSHCRTVVIDVRTPTKPER